MIETTIKMTVPAEKRKEVLQTIKAILGPIRLERGCISCNCYVDIEAENSIYFKEEWTTGEDLDTHLRSVHFKVLIGAMKLLNKEPDIRFNTITSTAGAEAIAAAQDAEDVVQNGAAERGHDADTVGERRKSALVLRGK